MSRPTNNYLVTKNEGRKNINFIKTLAEIGEPFNSTLLEDYPEYTKGVETCIYGDKSNDKKECFLSILNKIGEDGCQVLTDRIINYIDDVSNIDTTTPSALLSQANSLGYPYKDKKTVEQLTRLSKCSPYLQNLIWAVSTNATNSKTILDRLNIASTTELSAKYDTKSVNDAISGIYYDDISSKVFGRRYFYLYREDTQGSTQDIVSNNSSPALIDFSWMFYSIFADEITNKYKDFNQFASNVIDFGKYNRTIYAIICYTYLYSQLHRREQIQNSYTLNELNELSKTCMPFLYDTKLFDPIQAAWSILYDTATLSDYDSVYHDIIKEFMKVYNEKLNELSYNTVMRFLEKNEKLKKLIKENINFVYRLNANSFTYQQLIYQFIIDANMLFGIDIKDYFDDYQTYMEELLNNKSSDGFYYLCNDSGNNSLLVKIDFNAYIKKLIESIFKFGEKIRTLREDLRLMTFRNSYKGTTALIQFSVIEYLRDCIIDLAEQAKNEYNFKNNTHVIITPEIFKGIIEALEGTPEEDVKEGKIIKERKTQKNIAVGEYWDYTEYFNRYYIDADEQSTEILNINSGSRVDWNNPDPKGDPDGWRVYGSMDEKEIFDFYTKVLNIDKNVYLNKNEDAPDFVSSTNYEQLVNLRTFLRDVYNSGVFTRRTNDNYEAIYSGKESETTNDSPWVAYKNDKGFISKEIHPYIWNFTRKIATKLYKANAVTLTIQNAEYELLSKHINGKQNKYFITGNILDQYRLSKNFVDSSGYVTRYEHRDHVENEKTQSYDGIIYPQFGYELHQWENFDTISSNWSRDPISTSIKQRWYTDQLVTLSDYQSQKELSCIKDLFDNDALLNSIYFNNGHQPQSELSGVLGNYCIDIYETAYGTDPYNGHRFLYKENGYPFMRPLINGKKGMLFINADNDIDDEFMDNPKNIDNEINDKFPRIVLSKDGTHLLLRTAKNKIRSYTVGSHKNEINETEKALILNAEISCDSTIFEDKFFNDSLIKTIDDDFYILVPHCEGNKFTNYLIYIKKNRRIGALKLSVKNIPEDNNQIFRSGLFLSEYGTHVNVNTYYLNKNQILPDTSEVSAIYHSNSYSVGNHKTPYKNWKISSSSFDVLNQFIQHYSSHEYTYDDMSNIEVSFDDISCPSVDLSIAALESNTKIKEVSEVSVLNDFLYGENSDGLSMAKSTSLPFIRTYNINSDAGFNPVYIGKQGRIILSNRQSQSELAHSTGAAFELLGPEVNFDENVIADTSTEDDIYNEISNDNDRMFERIHEFYSKTDGENDEKTFTPKQAEYAQSFDVANYALDRISSYRYGYASIVENEFAADGANKNDEYRIEDIISGNLTDFHDENGNQFNYVKTINKLIDNNRPLKCSNTGYHRFYIFLGVNNKLYSLIPRIPGTRLQKDKNTKNIDTEFFRIKQALESNNETHYDINFNNTFVFNKIRFQDGHAYVYGDGIHEIVNADIYLVCVSSKNDTRTPNFMLPTEELKKALTNISSDMIDEHIRVPHTDATKNYIKIKNASSMNDWEINSVNSEISCTNGSLVFSITETDSEFMNKLLPDQRGKHDLKTVTVEALNDYYRYQELATRRKTFDILDYDFKPWQIIDLNLTRIQDPDVDIGFDDYESSIGNQYIIQPSDQEIEIRQDAANKYVISFWRKSETNTSVQNKDATLDNVLPNKIKTTEDYKPIYAHEHQALKDLLNNKGFIPQLMVQWEYEINDKSAINLKFNNAAIGDSPFINTNSGLEYKSLSTFAESIMLKPGESGYIDVVAPNHVQAGRTIFYNIPLMRALATNISDNKPKFMLTFLNDKSNDHLSLESNNYALVFMSASTPQVSNSDIVYATCYVAPMISDNQTIPPSVSNAVTLSELSFNFDIANIINFKTLYDESGHKYDSTNNVLIERLTPITPDNTISKTASTCIGLSDDSHQLRINEPIGEKTDGFMTVDMKINLQELSKLNLKNAMLTAHGTVIAYDNEEKPKSLPIVKVFGCSLDRIGTKHILGVKKYGTENENGILFVTQNSKRETALLVNPDSKQ